MKLGEAVYKSQQKPADKTGGNNDDKKDNKEKENVVDAEVVDSKEDKEKEPKTNKQEKFSHGKKRLL